MSAKSLYASSVLVGVLSWSCGPQPAVAGGAAVHVASATSAPPVALRITAEEGNAGSLQAELPSGEKYLGSFVEKLKWKRYGARGKDNPHPLPGLSADAANEGGSVTRELTATLRGTAGGQMVCRFLQPSPTTGNVGIDRGYCDLAGFGRVDATLTPIDGNSAD